MIVPAVRSLCWCASALAALVGVAAAQEPSPPPRPTAIVERTGSRLAQLDVTVAGPAGVVEALTREDFELRVDNRWVETFFVDRVCAPTVAEGAAESAPAAEAVGALAPPADSGPTLTVVFYFDQPHMTMAGRNRSIDIAKDMVSDLFGTRARGMIVSAARELKVFTDMTSDAATLLAALEALRNDPKHWDPFAMSEDQRLAEVQDEIRRDIDLGMGLARRYQQEEVWRAEQSIERVSMTLGRLAELDPPKALVYFSDTLRREPGRHYTDMFGARTLRSTEIAGQTAETSRLLMSNSFDRLYNKASALGVRFYAVQAQGLAGQSTLTQVSASRWRTAEDTLSSIAAETGGKAFVGGYRAETVGDAVLEDLRCLYLISFDPAGFDEDRALPVRLSAKRKDVEVQTRGRLVVESESAARLTRLMGAFATGTGQAAPLSLRVVPVEWIDGSYRALVQLVVPGTVVRGATWDVGASLVSRGKVREDVSGRVTVADPGVTVVFEDEMSFPPGPFELVGVAHERTTDRILSGRLESDWPDPNEAVASIAAVAVLQPVEGAFTRDGASRISGSLAHGEADALRGDRPTALVGLVCRSSSSKEKLRVERSLSGDNAVPFEPLELDGGERCAQFRDLVPAGVMTEGEILYRVTVGGRGQTLAETTTRLVVGPDGGPS